MSEISRLEQLISESEKDAPSSFSERALLHQKLAQEYLNNNQRDRALIQVKKYVFNALANTNKELSDSFFSFRSFTEYSWKDLKDNTISLVHPSMFNDPLDPVMLRWLTMKIDGASGNEREYYCMLKKAFDGLRIRCFVYSTMGIGAIDTLMWAHYADSHKGFCVQYQLDGALSLIRDEESTTFLEPIVYSDFSSGISSLSIEDALFHKTRNWAYENEYRLVHYSNKDESEKKEGVFLLENCLPKAVYLGAKCTEDNAFKMQLLLRNKDVALYQMEYDYTREGQMFAKRIG